MRVGLALSQYGRFARRDAVIEVARGAEDLGFDSLWTGDRILDPVSPRDRYPGSADGRMPPEFTTFLDPLSVLTVAAAVTERVRLGTSTLNAPWYSPVLLARTLTSSTCSARPARRRSRPGLVLGRVRGRGRAVERQGGAAGGDPRRAGARLGRRPGRALRSRLFTVPASRIEPKPVQRPRPPIYLGGFSQAALERVGRRADGWVAPGRRCRS